MKAFLIMGLALLSLIAMSVDAQETIELDTTTIKGNTELPKAMFVVPWQDKTRRNDSEQQLIIHDLYSDLFDPVMPAYIPSEDFIMPEPAAKTN